MNVLSIEALPNTAENDVLDVSVLLIEEHRSIRESLADWLAFVLVDAPVIGTSFDDAPCMIAAYRPEIIVVDIALKGREAIEMVGTLKELAPTARLVALCGYADRRCCESVLRAGADACLPAWEVRKALASVLRELMADGGSRPGP